MSVSVGNPFENFDFVIDSFDQPISNGLVIPIQNAPLIEPNGISYLFDMLDTRIVCLFKPLFLTRLSLFF
jgi:hypothetical protein